MVYRLILGVLVSLLFLTLGTSSIVMVEESERGVVLRGKAENRIVEPGYRMKIPILEEVRMVSLKTQKTELTNLGTYTSDSQAAELNVSINWHIDKTKISEFYHKYGTVEELEEIEIKPKMRHIVKIAMGQFTADMAIQQGGRLTEGIDGILRLAFTEDNTPIIYTKLNIENINFEDRYENGVKERMLAGLKIEETKHNLARVQVEAEIMMMKTKAEGARVREAALSEAERIITVGRAEAQALELRSKALAINPSGLAELMQAERWDGKLPMYMLSRDTVPILGPAKEPAIRDSR